MITLDTNALIFDALALAPEHLTPLTHQTIEASELKRSLACCGISLWEIAMFIVKRGIEVQIRSAVFMQGMLVARAIQVLPITSDYHSTRLVSFFRVWRSRRAHNRCNHKAQLIISDNRLLKRRKRPLSGDPLILD